METNSDLAQEAPYGTFRCRVGPADSLNASVPMTKGKTAAIILAAGKGTRMKSALPQVLPRIAGRPMVGHLLDAVAPLRPDRVFVLHGPGKVALAAPFAPHPSPPTLNTVA